jgi:hypothetical protein
VSPTTLYDDLGHLASQLSGQINPYEKAPYLAGYLWLVSFAGTVAG